MELTLEQWAELDGDAEGEFVDGRIEEEEQSTFFHAAVVSWLIGFFGKWAHPRGGWVFGSEAKLGISKRRGRKPDVSVILPGERPPARRSSMARRPPSIVVEVVTPHPRDVRRDRVAKLGEYAGFGVRWYWLVDPQAHQIEILELGADGRYTIALSASEGAHAVPGCDGLTIDLDALWTEIERLPDEEPEE